MGRTGTCLDNAPPVTKIPATESFFHSLKRPGNRMFGKVQSSPKNQNSSATTTA
jgi:hypothetical protein